MKVRTLVGCFILALILTACGDSGSSTATPSATGATADGVTVQQGGKSATVRVEIAATFAQRQQGLMFRETLSEEAGMLFLFPADVQYGFWMKNTTVPLDIAYISSTGEIVDIKAAKPLDETVLVPGKPYRYVLEVNQGWFERHGMGLGAEVTLPADLPPAE